MMKLLLPIAVMIMLVGCSSESAPSKLPTITMQIGTKKFTLEVASDEQSRQVGLMNRDSMPADHGMLFVMDHSEVQGFWMKNTRIPLDIVFLSPDARVVSIHSMEPLDLRTTSSDYEAKYAIELNQGTADAAGVKVGDKLVIPPLPNGSKSDPASKPTTR